MDTLGPANLDIAGGYVVYTLLQENIVWNFSV